MMVKSGCMAAVVIKNPPPSNRRGAKFGQCPTIRLFCCSAPRAPANALNATKLPGTTVTDRHQTAARRSRRHCRRKAGSSTFAHLTVADHSISLPPTCNPSAHFWPSSSSFPGASPILSYNPPAISDAGNRDRRPQTSAQTFAGNSRGVNKQVPTLPRQPSSPLPPSTSHEGASLARPTRLLSSPDSAVCILPPARTNCLAAAE